MADSIVQSILHTLARPLSRDFRVFAVIGVIAQSTWAIATALRTGLSTPLLAETAFGVVAFIAAAAVLLGLPDGHWLFHLGCLLSAFAWTWIFITGWVIAPGPQLAFYGGAMTASLYGGLRTLSSWLTIDKGA